MRVLPSLALLLCLAQGALARRGVVETRDGRFHEGHIRFESNAVIVVDAAREVWVQVPLTNLAGLALESPAPPAPENATTASGELPRPWQSLDVGAVARTGTVDFRNGLFRVKSTGTNILADADSFQFIYKQVRGNSQLVTRVARVSLADPWSRAGVMMRESLAADSRNVSLALTAARGGIFSVRERRGGETVPSLDPAMHGVWWLKLKRDGDVFTALKSSNGRQWWTVGKVTVPMTEEIYVGLTAVAAREGSLSESTFDDVAEAPSLRNRSFTPQMELRSGSLQAGYPVTMNDTAIHFDAREGRPPIARHAVAHLRFQPLPSRLASWVSAGRPGALLTSGEFIEGECRGLEEGFATISSIPLGLLRYDVNNEVIAIVLTRRATPARHAFEVTTVNGARWFASDVTFDRDWLIVREPLLGPRRIPAHEISEVRRTI